MLEVEVVVLVQVSPLLIHKLLGHEVTHQEAILAICLAARLAIVTASHPAVRASMAEMRLMIPQPLRLMVLQTLLLAHPSAKLVARLRPFLPPTALLAIMPVLKLVQLLRHLLFVRFRRPHHYHADRIGTAVRSRKMIPTALLSVVLLRARRCITTLVC